MVPLGALLSPKGLVRYLEQAPRAGRAQPRISLPRNVPWLFQSPNFQAPCQQPTSLMTPTPAKVVRAALKSLTLGLRAGSLADGAQWRNHRGKFAKVQQATRMSQAR
jgi:hypothetical protein